MNHFDDIRQVCSCHGFDGRIPPEDMEKDRDGNTSAGLVQEDGGQQQAERVVC